MENEKPKPTIPEVHPLVINWYAKPGNSVGGIFHVLLENGNCEQYFADQALKDAHLSGDKDAIHLAELLTLMSSTQRRKLCHLNKT
jgi:hypothetical protein